MRVVEPEPEPEPEPGESDPATGLPTYDAMYSRHYGTYFRGPTDLQLEPIDFIFCCDDIRWQGPLLRRSRNCNKAQSYCTSVHISVFEEGLRSSLSDLINPPFLFLRHLPWFVASTGLANDKRGTADVVLLRMGRKIQGGSEPAKNTTTTTTTTIPLILGTNIFLVKEITRLPSEGQDQ